MDVEVEFSLYVMGAELAKAIHPSSQYVGICVDTASNLLGFIPGDNI